jgi:hypothetical protein
MVREYSNGIETEENKAKFKKFCEVHKVPDSFENWIWWKDNIRDVKIL